MSSIGKARAAVQSNAPTPSIALAVLAIASLCGPARAATTGAELPANVNAVRLLNANAEPGEWMAVGRTYDEQRFSPLTQINTDNVGKLGLAWYADFDSNRGQEATPLEIDGVLYVSTAWSKVKAYDAESGRLLWAFDPKVPGEFAGRGCCDVVNRGLAAWHGRIYVATYDGRLIALDARNGHVLWHVLTIDHSKPVTSTGAPRVVKGRVLIGNSGGEFGVRGYISAYDAETGHLDWRFYTVPGNPANGFERPILKTAARTWHGDFWKLGGGGTVWDAIVYDPGLNLVYFGTGNGTPWNRRYRGSGGGDNLFVASVIAVNADTGAYVWHYQETPGDEWDYDATTPLMLATLKIDGRARRVLMQASKNGFFYVLDATTGTVISAKPFVTVSWARGIDPETGRPIFNPEARYDLTGKVAVVQPGGQGAHAWHPFSYDPQTGLVYFSAIETSGTMKSAAHFTPVPMGANIGLDFQMPSDRARAAPSRPRSRLVAWDPVAQRAVWQTGLLGHIGAGVLTTGGGLVFQGTTDGEFVAYRATDGRPLWSMPVQTGVVAAPATFERDGVQYIAEEVGYGLAAYGVSNQSRLLVFKLGGNAMLPPAPPPPPPPVLDPPPSTASQATIEQGHVQFAGHCATCHEPIAANREVFPDLRYSRALGSSEAFDAIVLGGALQPSGMASFKGRLTRAEVHEVRAYLIWRANQAKSPPPAPR
ncbi:MAG TPA: PQQ-dependent dehydrogenase, methanol/ethanol family [Steroidobacteraceae bacterium]|nr:PQQ-dependent dehydrogenase, methanol/ethanol family [Steroidobacteraceae bacterium]